MKITDEVVMDLLPVYLAGEASEDTRALVEAYFRDHPEFAALTTKMETQLSVLQASRSDSNQEKEILMRVKRILRLRSILFGAALFCSAMPLLIVGNSDEGVTWIMLRDAPIIAVVFGVGAAIIWGAYAWTHRILKDNGR
jgi:hypothetical protein